MKNLNAILLATVIAITAASGFCEARADATTRISIEDEAWIKGEKVYLKDIAGIEGTARLQEQLGAIYLCYSPGPDRHKILRGSWIESKIRSARWLPADTALSIPESVRISRRWQAIQEERFLDLFNGYIANKLNAREADFRVSRFKVVGNGSLSEGEIEIELVPQGDRRLLGYVSLTAIVRVDGRIEQRVVLSGWVDRFENVVCTNGSLKRNSIIDEDDISLKRKNISRLPYNVLKNVDWVIDKRVKQNLRADTAILANMVEDPPLIKKGDKVTIIAESPFLLITASGIAQVKGALGDQIRVKNCMNRREIIARIVSASTVRIEF